MSLLQEMSAAELADALEAADDFPHNTGGLSLLDEASLGWAMTYPGIYLVQKKFAAARYRHLRSYTTETGSYSDEEWNEAVQAAYVLAVALREFGDERLVRCKELAGWGDCGHILRDGKACPGTHHL